MIRALLFLLLSALPALAQPLPEPPRAPPERIVAGLSRDDVDITTSFDGSDILIYGAVKRETPIPPGPPLEVIVTVEAPPRALTVWRKERRFARDVNHRIAKHLVAKAERTGRGIDAATPPTVAAYLPSARLPRIKAARPACQT